jgi:hypothetical protein
MLSFDTDLETIKSAIDAAQSIEFLVNRTSTAFKDIDAPSRWTKYPLLSADEARLLGQLFSHQVTATDQLDALGIKANSCGGEIYYRQHSEELLAVRISWR